MNNETLKTAAKNILKDLLSQCEEGNQRMFKLMYARDNGRRSVEDAEKMNINDVVDQMDPERYDWAISQCERTIEKMNKQKDDNKN
jgi:hypothetical protein